MDTNGSWNYRMLSNKTARGQHLILWNSIIDNYKMSSEIMLVGTLDGIDPTTKCHWEKIMLAIPMFSYFFNFRCIGFCSAYFEFIFRIRLSCVLYFVAAKKVPCIEFCSCAPCALCLVPIKILCTTPPTLSELLNPDSYVSYVSLPHSYS